MELLHHIAIGFGVAFTPSNLSYVLWGTLLGALVGGLPRLGALTAIALVLPFVHHMGTTQALILLLCIYLGSRHTESINPPVRDRRALLDPWNTPNGHQPIFRSSHSRASLSAVRWRSLISGLIGICLLAISVGPLTEFIGQWGSAEYLSLLVLGLVGAVVLSSGSIMKAIGMTLLGLLLGQVGPDMFSGFPRYTLGIEELHADGINFIVLAIGILVFSRTINVLEPSQEPTGSVAFNAAERGQEVQALRGQWWFVVRSAAWGSLLGVLPGRGERVAAYAAQAADNSMTRTPAEPDNGERQLRTLASRECASSAAEKTSFISVLSMGIAPSAISALLVAAMTIKGVAPGPELINIDPELFWGLIAAMSISTLLLVLLNRPLMSLWITSLQVPYRYVFPTMTIIGCIGIYSLNQNAFEVLLAVGAAALGYVFHKLGCELVPLLLGFIVGPSMEQHLRQALVYAHGDWGVFLSRPTSGALLGAAALMIVVAMFPSIKRLRGQVFQSAR